MITPEDREPWLPLKWVSMSPFNAMNPVFTAYLDHHPRVVCVIRDNDVTKFEEWHITRRELPDGRMHEQGRYRTILSLNTSDPLAIRCALLSLREVPPFTPEYIDAETRIVIRSTGPG